jgi:hypothetical protein
MRKLERIEGEKLRKYPAHLSLSISYTQVKAIPMRPYELILCFAVAASVALLPVAYIFFMNHD